ncbi:MAG: hypothetical protein ACRD4U_05795 [Candidatus Acidiferrales bacterium]
MNLKKLALASGATFVAYSALAYVIHNVLLVGDYQAIASTLRTPEEFLQRLPLLYLGNLIFALAATLIYAHGYEPSKNWIGQGFRFGLLLGTLMAPVALTEYVVYPVPGALALKWIVFGYLQLVITAWVVAGIYRTE